MQPLTTIKLIVSAVIFRIAAWNNFKTAEKEHQIRNAQVSMATKFFEVALGIRGSHSGAQNFEMSPRFLENLRIPALNYICSCS
jgi:hypothetical protein